MKEHLTMAKREKLQENTLTRQERHQLVMDNEMLVTYLANKYRGDRKDIEDMIQSGFEGLLRAAKYYTPERGSFSAYASFEITCAIRDWIFHSTPLIHITDSHRTQLTAYSRKIAEVAAEGIALTSAVYDEIAEQCNLPKDTARALLYNKSMVQIDAPVQHTENESETLQDVIEDVNSNVESGSELLYKDLVRVIESFLDRAGYNEEPIYRELFIETVENMIEASRPVKSCKTYTQQEAIAKHNQDVADTAANKKLLNLVWKHMPELRPYENDDKTTKRDKFLKYDRIYQRATEVNNHYMSRLRIYLTANGYSC